MAMMLKLLLVMALLAVSAIVLNKLFPSKDGAAPRSLNDLMDQIEIDEEASGAPEAETAAEGAEASADAAVEEGPEPQAEGQKEGQKEA